DAHQSAAQLGRPAEAHDDRGRRRECLGLEAEPIAHRAQPLLEAMRGGPVAVERAAEREDESDRGLRVHTGIIAPQRYLRPRGTCSQNDPLVIDPKSTNARAATQASETGKTN